MIDFIKKMFTWMAVLLISSIGHIAGYCEDSCSSQPVCCGQAFISADFLYWRAFESGLDTCSPSEVFDIVTADDTVISIFHGKGRSPNFNWDPGFRIGAGYEFARSKWDIAAFWTHFQSHTRGNHGNRPRWNIDLDVIDAIAAYDFNFDSCFNLWPFIGLRAVQIDQKLRHGKQHHFTLALNDDLITFDRGNKEKFQGIGPLMGLEADWNIGCSFSFYFMGSISWLYGNYNIRLIELDEEIDALDFFQLRKNLDASLAVADVGLGIRWQKCFCNDMRLVLQLGLEHHRYFDFNRIGGYGDLSFDGVNLSAGIEF